MEEGGQEREDYYISILHLEFDPFTWEMSMLLEPSSLTPSKKLGKVNNTSFSISYLGCWSFSSLSLHLLLLFFITLNTMRAIYVLLQEASIVNLDHPLLPALGVAVVAVAQQSRR